jgi:hypothetical protein
MDELSAHCYPKTFDVSQQDSIPGNDKCHYNIIGIEDKNSRNFFKNKSSQEPTSIFYCCESVGRQLTLSDIKDIDNYKCS